MLELLSDDLARYVDNAAAEEPPLLRELREVTRRELQDPQMQVGRVEGTFLRLLTQLAGARRVLEIGTYSGYSTLCLASALPDDGTVLTCDIDPAATDVARTFFSRSPHGDKITLRLGPAADTLRELPQSERFDVAFIDADKESYCAYWEEVVPRIRPGGIVIADNTLWSGNVLAPRTAAGRGIADFNARVAADARVEQVLLSVRDGMTLARKLDAGDYE